MKIRARAPGKLILIGEYIVLEGQPALVAAVDRDATVELESDTPSAGCLVAPDIGIESSHFEISEDGAVRFPDLDGDSSNLDKLRVVRSVLTGWLDEQPGRSAVLRGLRIKIDTSGFVSTAVGAKLGLGSSAATAVALYTALCGLEGGAPDDAVRNHWLSRCLTLHREAQGGVGSGVDVAASVFGGTLRYVSSSEAVAHETVRGLCWPDGLHPVVVFAGRGASTTALVRQVYQFKASRRDDYDRIIGSLSSSAQMGIGAVESGDVDLFLAEVSRYCDLLGELGEVSGADIISAEHRRIRDIAKAHGAAYKSSGAGGGDLGIAFGRSPAEAETIKGAFEGEGFVCPTLGFDAAGASMAVTRGSN